MPELSFVSPLQVPEGTQLTPRSQKRYDSGFSPSMSMDEALNYLHEECLQLPADARVTLYSNYEQIAVAAQRKRVGDEPAVCCEVELNHQRYHFVCHQWGMAEHNLYAIHLTLRALHNIARWGLADYERLLQAFAPQVAAPSAASAVNASDMMKKGRWLAVLGLDESATLEQANAAYRHHAKRAAESEEGLLRLNQAIADARAYFAQHHGG